MLPLFSLIDNDGDCRIYCTDKQDCNKDSYRRGMVGDATIPRKVQHRQLDSEFVDG